MGLTGTAPLEVMSHNGPVYGGTTGSGLARVAYTIEIKTLQEAGDYSNVLTYVVTPKF